MFLPQLIMAASVTQAAFEVIRKHMVMSDNAPVSKGKIVIATVKGMSMISVRILLRFFLKIMDMMLLTLVKMSSTRQLLMQ